VCEGANDNSCLIVEKSVEGEVILKEANNSSSLITGKRYVEVEGGILGSLRWQLSYVEKIV
jgi:hypothetical protein